jgi:hypothetical protein
MRSGFSIGLAALLLVGLGGGGAMADMKVYYHVGSWDAFSGQDTDGSQVCGVGSTNPADKRAFSIRFKIGGDTVSFQLKKPGWEIPANTQIPVVMQLGLDAPWTMQGNGNGQDVDWTMDRDGMRTFDDQFRRGSSMTFSFPNGNEAPWLIGLNGSTAASNAFGRCVTDLTARSSAPAAAATPQGPTQPFGQTPSQPYSNAPAQPGSDTTPAPATQPGSPGATQPAAPAPNAPPAAPGATHP